MADADAPQDVETKAPKSAVETPPPEPSPASEADRYDPTAIPDEGPGLLARLAGVTVTGSKAGGKVLAFVLRGLWYLTLLWYSLPLLVNLRSLWKYPETGRLRIRTQTELAYMYPVISSGPVFTLFMYLGVNPAVLGYLWVVLLIYAVYTAIEDVTWHGAKVVFFAVIAIMLAVAVLGLQFQFPVFKHLAEGLAYAGVKFDPYLCNAVSVGLLIPFLPMFISRMFTEQVVFERNSMTVLRIGESKSTHTRNAYSCLEQVDDVNETVFGYKTLHMKARSRLDPDYRFRNVPGLIFIGPTLRQLTTAQDVELVDDGTDDDEDDGTDGGHVDG